jgi:hypothetical protein
MNASTASRSEPVCRTAAIPWCSCQQPHPTAVNERCLNWLFPCPLLPTQPQRHHARVLVQPPAARRSVPGLGLGLEYLRGEVEQVEKRHHARVLVQPRRTRQGHQQRGAACGALHETAVARYAHTHPGSRLQHLHTTTRPAGGRSQVNRRTHSWTRKLKCLISLCSNPCRFFCLAIRPFKPSTPLLGLWQGLFSGAGTRKSPSSIQLVHEFCC